MITQLSQIDETSENSIRRTTGLAELDRVLGGGVVDGSVILLAGDPGIGKSTLLLQICQTLCDGRTVLYLSGEESPRQIRMRASRLKAECEQMYVASVTEMEHALQAIERINPDVVMVDSIQTMHCSESSSSAGSVAQIRDCTAQIIKVAKSSETPVFIVGHVNKDGGIAGPRVLEHMVDVVLHFEGERYHSYRILRAVKNRFGSTNEIGVFEMTDAGLQDVENPSLMLLSGRPAGVSGTSVACVMEGTRSILAEVQALVSKSGLSVPRRTATGYDQNRMSLLLAVLEKRCGYFFGNLDAYVNVVGGLRLDEPAVDLPVTMSLVSNLLDRPVPDKLVAFGEVGLAGEVRSVMHLQQRVNECIRLGFDSIVLPKTSLQSSGFTEPKGIRLIPVEHVSQAFSLISGS